MKCTVQTALLIFSLALYSFGQASIIEDISDTSAWYLGNYDGAISYGSLSDQGYTITIENPGPQTWSIQFTQNNIEIDSGKIYQFSFIASSNNPRTIETSISQDGSDYQPYSKRDTVSLTNSPQKFEYVFIMKHTTDPNARIEFNCGTQTGDILLSEVKIIETDKPVLELKTPEEGICIHEGSEIDITWLSLGNETPVKIDFSKNNGLNWETLDSGVPDSGSYKWLPSGIYSPWCLLRISAENDGQELSDISGLFEIAPQTELVYNGTFTNENTGWKFDVYDGSASHSVVNGVSKIQVESSGSEPWHIQFIQDNLLLQENVTYILSCTAYSEVNDSMFVGVNRSESPHESFLYDSSNMISLTNEPRQYSAEFTVKENAGFARIEFNCGLSGTAIFIDNVSLVKKYSTRSIAKYTFKENRHEKNQTLPGAIISFGRKIDCRKFNDINTKQSVFDIMGRTVISNKYIPKRDELKVSPGVYITGPNMSQR